MKIYCPNCQKTFNVDLSKLKDGVTVLCSNCNYKWTWHTDQKDLNKFLSFQVINKTLPNINKEIINHNFITAKEMVLVLKGVVNVDLNAHKDNQSLKELNKSIEELYNKIESYIDPATSYTNNQNHKQSNDVSFVHDLLSDINQKIDIETEESLDKVKSKLQKTGFVQYIITLIQNATSALNEFPDETVSQAWNYLSQAEDIINFALSKQNPYNITPNLRAHLILTLNDVHELVESIEHNNYSTIQIKRKKLAKRLQELQGHLKKESAIFEERSKFTQKKEKAIAPLTGEKVKQSIPIKAIEGFGNSNQDPKIQPIHRSKQSIEIKGKNLSEQKSNIKKEESNSLGELSEDSFNRFNKPLDPISKVESENTTGVALRKFNPINPGSQDTNQHSYYVRKTNENQNVTLTDDDIPSFIKSNQGKTSHTVFMDKKGDSGPELLTESDDDEIIDNNSNYSSNYPKNLINKREQYEQEGSSRSTLFVVITAIIIVLVVLLLGFILYKTVFSQYGNSQTSQKTTQQLANGGITSSAIQITQQSAHFVRSENGTGNDLVVSGMLYNNTSKIIKSITLEVSFVNQVGKVLTSWKYTVVKLTQPRSYLQFETKHNNMPNVSGSIKIRLLSYQ